MGDTFYTYREMKRPTRMQKYNNQGTGQNLHKQHQQSTSHSYMRYRNNTKPSKRKNPLRNCLETWCSIRRSINQWNSQCPDRSSEEITYMVHELTLQNSSLSANEKISYIPTAANPSDLAMEEKSKSATRSSKSATILVNFGPHTAAIKTDIVHASIPLTFLYEKKYKCDKIFTMTQ